MATAPTGPWSGDWYAGATWGNFAAPGWSAWWGGYSSSWNWSSYSPSGSWWYLPDHTQEALVRPTTIADELSATAHTWDVFSQLPGMGEVDAASLNETSALGLVGQAFGLLAQPALGLVPSGATEGDSPASGAGESTPPLAMAAESPPEGQSNAPVIVKSATSIDFQKFPSALMEQMFSEGRATQSTDGRYAAVVDVFGTAVQYCLYEKYQPTKVMQWNFSIFQVPDGPTAYRLVKVGYLGDVAADGTLLFNSRESVDHFLARMRTAQNVDEWVKQMGTEAEIKRARIDLTFVEFAAAMVPGVQTYDYYQAGDWGNCALSLAGDVALVLTGPAATAAKAGNAIRIAKAMRYTAAGLEGAIGGIRAGQGIYELSTKDGDTYAAAGYLGEAALRMFGMSNNLIAGIRTKAASVAAGAISPRILRRAINAKTWQEYEAAIRSIYGEAALSAREYTAIVDGKLVSGVADNVAEIAGRRVAIEAKFCEDWATSLRNPASAIGRTPFAVEEQANMVQQAKKYAAAFPGGVIYYSNSPELIAYYSRAFREAGITNFTFVLQR